MKFIRSIGFSLCLASFSLSVAHAADPPQMLTDAASKAIAEYKKTKDVSTVSRVIPDVRAALSMEASRSAEGTCCSLVLACTLNVGSLAAASPREETVKAMSERLETALVEFDRKPDARQLATVAEELYQLPSQQEAMSSARSFKLRSIVRVLGAVEKKIDPTLDPDDPPSRNVAPPGHEYPSGVAPSSISDEKVRKQYEGTVAANKAKVAKFNLQVDLHRLKERAVTLLETLASDADSDKSQSLTELTSLLDQYGIDEESRLRILNAAKDAR